MRDKTSRHLLAVAVSLAGVAGIAGIANAAQQAVSIPFADIGNIRNWQSDSNDELYIESMTKHWYRATFWAPCQSLPFAVSIAFVTEPNGSLDKYSSILVDGERCWFKSFETAKEPQSDTAAK